MLAGTSSLIERAKIVVAVTLFAWTLGLQSHAQPANARYDGHKIVRVTVKDASQLQTLVALDAASPDFEIWSDAVGTGVIEVRVSPEQKRALDDSGLAYEAHVEDLGRRLDELFASRVGAGFFDIYRTYDEHVTLLNDLAGAHPDLAETFSVGLSVEGREMWAIRITGPGLNKPAVMYHGGQHGNEIMGPCVIAYMAELLLTHYDTDPEIQALVNNVEWFLLPIMNPDGYVDSTRYNANGFDLNRNWGGPGAQPDPFSQPETAAMRDFFLAHPNVRAHLDIHTSGRMVLWPWGYTDALCADHGTFSYLGDEMAERIFEFRGIDYAFRGPIYTTIYPVYGGSVDYSYGVHGMWAISFELGTSHLMPVEEILPTAQELAPAMMFLSNWISDCNENDVLDTEEIDQGLAEDCNDNATPDECEPDCNNNAVQDSCDIAEGTSDDCNDNAAPDACDISSGTSYDCDGNQIPDECECSIASKPNDDSSPVPAHVGLGTKNRYLSFEACGRQAVQVTFLSIPGYEYAEGRTMWVQEPLPVTEVSSAADPSPPPTYWVGTLGCDPYYTDFNALGVVDVYDDAIVPGATFEIRVIDEDCDAADSGNFSEELSVTMSAAGDIVGDCADCPCTAPNGVVDFVDIAGVVDKFKNAPCTPGGPGVPRKARSDLANTTAMQPIPDRKIDFMDISYCVDAFRDQVLPLPGPPRDDPCR